MIIKYHTLFFFRKFRKMSQNLSSAAVVIGTLRGYSLAVKGDPFMHMRVCDIAGVQRDKCPYLVNWSIFV